MCTNLLLTVPATPGSSDPSVRASARALELSGLLRSSIYLVPRAQQFPLVKATRHIPTRLAWQNQYGFIGIASPSAFAEFPCFMDGLNEKGLSAAALWLPGTVYPNTGSHSTLFFSEIVAWILGNYAQVSDLEADLNSGTVVSIVGPAPQAPEFMPLHFIATDPTGASVVIEFVDGAMHVYGPSTGSNGVPAGATSDGVLTNAPTYDWQRTNLANYQTLNIVGPTTSTKSTGGPGVGSGMLGMPGDPMSSSRFIRAATLRKGYDSSFNLLPSDGTGWLPAPGGSGFASPVQTVVNVAMQLVQMVMETPYGTTLAVSKKDAPTIEVGDWTMWCVVRDHTNATYYFTTAFNGIMRGISLTPDLFDPTNVPQFPNFPSIALLPSPSALPWYEPVTFA